MYNGQDNVELCPHSSSQSTKEVCFVVNGEVGVGCAIRQLLYLFFAPSSRALSHMKEINATVQYVYS